MHPDVFITVAFTSLVALFAVGVFCVALFERRRDAAAAARDSDEASGAPRT